MYDYIADYQAHQKRMKKEYKCYEYEATYNTASLDSLFENAWAQIRSDADFSKANRYESY